jgi:26S proteasome regulatory subunit T3
MADAIVENPINIVPPHKKALATSIPNVDIEGFPIDETDQYQTFKKLQAQLEFVACRWWQLD